MHGEICRAAQLWRAVETHVFMNMGQVERAIDLDVCNT